MRLKYFKLNFIIFVYNINMEELNNMHQKEETKIENNMPSSKSAQESGDKPDAGSEKKKLFAGVSISMVVLVAVTASIITVMMNRSSNNSESGTGNYAAVDDEPNTELTSGSVTTTIDGKSVTYKAAYIVDGIEATISSGTYESANDKEAVFVVINGGALKIDGDVTISKSGSEDFQGRGDEYSFYGTNSAVVVVGEGSSVSINGATINTNVSGANAVVATNGGVAKIAETNINTTKDNSRGLHATYGGMINADSVKISTKGQSCAALATDRGEGTVVADNMTLSTAGAGSPLIYSTGKITVTNSTGTATGAQIAVVEGKNSINLNGCEFEANGNGNRNGVDNAGVMIYQSMSGDASVGTGSFTATDCTMTVLSSSSVYDETPFFFVTNTNATIDLTDTTVTFASEQKFISAIGTNEWGKSGRNGGNVTVNVSGVNATNTDIEADEISAVNGI